MREANGVKSLKLKVYGVRLGRTFPTLLTFHFELLIYYRGRSIYAKITGGANESAGKIMKIIFSKHAHETMRKRGASEREVKEVIAKGEWHEAKRGRFEAKRNFPYHKEWNLEFYEVKQVNPVFIQEHSTITIITVYVFYFNK